MENHPIPQDITGFQFKLIGDMTIKQFAYIAGGVISGWIFFVLPLYSIIKIPIALGLIAFGVALAFLPISGRPLDLMIVKFFKAVFNPTQYMYIKDEDIQAANLKAHSSGETGGQKSLADLGRQQFTSFLGDIKGHKNKLDEKESVFMQQVTDYSSAAATQSTPKPADPHSFSHKGSVSDSSNADEPEIDDKTKVKPEKSEETLKHEAELLQKELNDAKAKESQQTQVNSKEYLEVHQKVLEMQKNLNDTLLQKQQLEQQLQELQKQVSAKLPVYSASVAAETPKETKFVRSIPQTLAKGAGMPIAPEFPNIVTGIIKDPRGNPIPNILVEVKDAQDNAVRAFKTNALGQFASATPLVNGKYSIYFEDSKALNQFDAVGFEANGQIILPIEVISVDKREELRRTLFN